LNKPTREKDGSTPATGTENRTEQGREYSPERRAFSRKGPEEVARKIQKRVDYPKI
jgi:hypothetical protein